MTTQLPLGGEGDLVPGGALPAELVHERLHLGEEGRCRGGVPVLDGPSFAQEGVGSVEMGAWESFCNGLTRVDVVGLDPKAERGKVFCDPWWESQYSSQFLAYPADLLGLAEFPETLPPAESSDWAVRSWLAFFA